MKQRSHLNGWGKTAGMIGLGLAAAATVYYFPEIKRFAIKMM